MRASAFEDSESDGETGADFNRGRARAAFRQRLDEFFAVWNGAWWSPSVTHHCGGQACCPGGRKTTIARLTSTAEMVMFNRSVPTIAANKWTKLGPVLDWMLLAHLAHGVLGTALQRLGFQSRGKQAIAIRTQSGPCPERAIRWVRVRISPRPSFAH